MLKEYLKGDSQPVSESFVSTDFDCPCKYEECRITLIETTLLPALEEMKLKVPSMKITSGYRCEKHNAEVGGAPKSTHLKGSAVDVVSSVATHEKIKEKALSIKAFANGGIGMYSDHVHVDVRGTKARW